MQIFQIQKTMKKQNFIVKIIWGTQNGDRIQI